MNKNSNTYTILYATVMVVVVAALLSVAALVLAPRQAENVLVEKKGAILLSIGEGTKMNEVPNKDQYINEEFEKAITRVFYVNAKGEQTDATVDQVMNSLGELPTVFANGTDLPVFEAKISGGETIYVIPVYGKGMWGPVWGYLAIDADGNTIYGATFDHKGETPGLGAEITKPSFSDQFKGKTMFEGDKFVSINVVKGTASTPHEIDAVSGGTVTSMGLKAMLTSCLGQYAPFFESLQK